MKKLFDYTLALFLLAATVFYVPGKNFHEAQELVFKGGIIAIFIFSLYIDKVRHIKDAWVNTFLGWAFLSILCAKANHGMMIEPFVEIFLVVVLYYIVAEYLDNWQAIFDSIALIILINAFFVATQIFKIDPLCLNDVAQPNTNIVGLFGHPMNLGIFMSVVIPLVFYKWRWAVVIPIALLILSRSWASIGIGLASFMVYMFFYRRKIFYYLLGAGALIGISSLFFVHYDTYVFRKFTLRWMVNWPMIPAILRADGLFGYGLGSFKYIVPQIKGLEVLLPSSVTGKPSIGGVDVPWCDYIGCALEMGTAILFVMLGIIISSWRRFYKMIQVQKGDEEIFAYACSLATIPFGIIFHSYMSYVNTGIVCVFIYALFKIKLKEAAC